MSIKRWKLGWKRCDCVKCEAALTIEQTEDDCGWVRWEDHKEEATRLKAEVERLHSQFANSERQVERLRKAGDGLYKSMLEIGCNEMADNFQYDDWWGSMRAWQSAKEGKQP